MTRSKLRRTLRWSYVALTVVLAVSLVTKLAPHIPGMAGSPWESVAKDVYEYLKDMALVFVTVVAAALAGIYQRRQSFIAALKEEWREIVDAKSKLYAYTRRDAPSHEDYIETFLAISATIDNMRTVYANVGETGNMIGIYPFAPLHDMRRALQTLDPTKAKDVSADDRRLVRDAVLQSFYALRENFLEELELEPPDRPLLAWGGRRHKKTGAPKWARDLQSVERRDTDEASPPDPRIDDFLRDLYEKEHTTEKPWRNLANGPLNGKPRNAKSHLSDDPDGPIT